MLKLDEDGLNYLLDVYGDLDGIEEAVNQFCDDIVEYGEIEIAGKWATVTDAACALRKLDVPGWSYPVDAERVIEDFESNVEDAFNDADIPYDAPIFEW